MRRMIDRNHRGSIGDTRYALRMFSLCVLLPCLALAAIGVAATAAHADQYAASKTTCFSAADWDANLGNVPCTTVLRPDNDVVQVFQGTSTRDQSICTISTAEVNDAYCHRIPALRGPQHVATPGSKRDCNPTTHVCVKVGVVQEDGSVRLTIYHFSMLYPIETCILGNASEEAGVYSAPCYGGAL